MPSVDYEKEAIPVQLGFSESIVPSDLGILAHNSPNWGEWDGGKIGGVPSWINPRDIPKIAPLRCEVCANRARRRNDGDANNSTNDEEGTMLRFVTQIYSPADSETGNDNAFHRSIYVFCCPHPECALGKEDHLNESSVVILRGQMSKENDFYPEDSDVEEIGWNKHESQAWNLNTCVVCGQRSSGKCPLTNQYFCGKKHQAAYHKAMKKHTNIDLSLLRYAESELVVEEEPVEQSGDGGEEEQTAKKINQSSIFVQEESGNKKHEKESEAKDDELLEQSDLNQMTGSATGTSDPLTVEFYTRIGRADGDVKEQCLRYCRWAERSEEGNTDDGDDGGPLWISSNDRPTSKADIPPCEYCGAERRFEFQVMPQMINFLKTSETDESAKKGKGSKLNLTEDGKRALMAASDIVDKAKEEGTEMDLPAEFQKKQEELVDMFKSKLFQNDGEGGESLDFGTIAIYTCTASCGGADYNDNRLGAYHKEFGWRQKSLE